MSMVLTAVHRPASQPAKSEGEPQQQSQQTEPDAPAAVGRRGRSHGLAGDQHRRLTQVPKMKSHKGAQKRFGATGSGKIYRVKSWRGHHLEIKSSRRKRRYDGKAIAGSAQTRMPSSRLLPYL